MKPEANSVAPKAAPAAPDSPAGPVAAAAPAGLLRGGTGRLPLVTAIAALLFLVLAGRLVQLGLDHRDDGAGQPGVGTPPALPRPELTDRRGNLLAIDVPTSSLYANPLQLISIDETAEKLVRALPELDVETLRKDLSARKRFVWIKRYLTPDERRKVFDLGLPGLEFIEEAKRFYPVGPLAAHVTGYVDAENKGVAGMEKAIDAAPQLARATPAGGSGGVGDPVALSIDLRVQHAVEAELKAALERYSAKAAVGIVLDIDSGEILALSSLPSFDPQSPAEALQPDRLDRARRGVYELGSVLKCFTIAMGLDEGAFTLEDRIDVATPLKLGTFAIKEHHLPADGTMSLEDIFIRSSNVGAARIARKVGIERHRAFMSRLGLLDRLNTEAGATGQPLQPANWQLADSLSIGFGYRLSVSPLQLAASAVALVDGGSLRPVTFLRRPAGQQPAAGLPVLKSETSTILRRFMRDNVEKGTGRLADVPGYRVGGKTGTARKVKSGGYSDELTTTFLGIFPAESPRYLTLVVLDEPQPLPQAVDRNDASQNAAPTTARIIERIAPFLGVKPVLPADN
jgi:cell division protein FtsI (penicillin-binding protein 3)